MVDNGREVRDTFQERFIPDDVAGLNSQMKVLLNGRDGVTHCIRVRHFGVSRVRASLFLLAGLGSPSLSLPSSFFLLLLFSFSFLLLFLLSLYSSLLLFVQVYVCLTCSQEKVYLFSQSLCETLSGRCPCVHLPLSLIEKVSVCGVETRGGQTRGRVTNWESAR